MAIPRPEDLFIAGARAIGTYTSPYLDPIEAHLVSLLRHHLPQVSSYAQTWLSTSRSVHAQRLPLMDPFHVLIIIALYLVAVFGGKVLMKETEKFNAKGLMLYHNAFLLTLSGYMCVATLMEAYKQGYSVAGNYEDETKTGWPMAKLMWLFYVSKTVEFMDTIIMVLKKNDRQISFLHMYHHCSIFAVWWFVTFKAPTGESYFSAALNSFIHVVMYGYYFCMAVGIRQVSFVKLYITRLQLTQFCCMMGQSIYLLWNHRYGTSKPEDTYPAGRSPYPVDIAVLLFFYMWTMLGLFANFFVKEARRTRALRRVAKETKSQ
ncbi:hypothetical protein HKX48_001152 [Thoreauomyces humboldtii]|nr:hypothetical protein HKX48_001152 [Thoreauomyces humboldtii]